MRGLLFIGVACALCVAACDQSDPPAVDEDYFPLRDGARYRYLHSKGGDIETVTIEADPDDPDRFEQIQSENEDGESSTSVLVREGGEVLRVSEEQLIDGELDYSTEYDPGFLRFDAAWADEEEGATETRTYDRTETHPGEEGKTRPRAHVFTVESTSETVTVPAGKFLDCLRVRRERDLENEAIVEADITQDEQSKMFWFAPGVGKVREENLITGSREELVDYEFPED